jgi:hypothetical protein
MNSNLNTPIPTPRSLTGEGLAAAVGIMGSALLVAKRLFAAKPPKPEPMSRADFYAELVALKDQIHAGHLVILEKLDANQRELLAALDRQVTRINALESGLARVDERTGYGSPKSEGRRPKEGRNPNPQPGGSGCGEAQ